MKYSEMNLPSNKKFGLFFISVFFILSYLLFLEKFIFISTVLFLLSIIILIILISKPDLLSPCNRLWMYLGYCLGRVISPIIIGLIFFIIFTPISILFKLIRRDELNLLFKKKDTYWVERNQKSIASASFKNQF